MRVCAQQSVVVVVVVVFAAVCCILSLCSSLPLFLQLFKYMVSHDKLEKKNSCRLGSHLRNSSTIIELRLMMNSIEII